MRPFLKSGSVVPALIYFGILVAGGWTLLLVFLALLASIPTFIFQIVSLGRRLSLTTFLMFIPIFGALFAIYRLCRRSGPLVILSVVTWTYPILILFVTGFSRIVLAALGSGAFWAWLTFHKAFRARPKKAATFVLAFPTLVFFLVASLAVPFLSSTSNLDSEFDSDHTFHDGSLNDASFESDQFSETSLDLDISGTSPSLYQYHQNTGTFSPELEMPTTHEQDAWISPRLNSDPALSYPSESDVSYAVSDSALIEGIFSQQDELMDTGTPGINPFQVDEITFDPFTGDPSVRFGSERLDFHYSETSDRLIGRLADGTSVEVWNSPVTGEIFVENAGHTSKFHLDPIELSWKSVGPEGTVRISQDPISGNIRINSPNFDSTFRYNPFENKLIAE